MLEVIQFENGRYGLRNTWTGIVLPNEYYTIQSATRSARRRIRKLNRTMRGIISQA